MRFTMPFAPVSAARPNWNTQTGKVNSRSYMPVRYKEWREKADFWFEDWLAQTDCQLIKELIYFDSDDKSTLVKDRKTGLFNPYFYGYQVKILMVLPQKSKKVLRAFPLSANQADIDNYSKAVIDAIFQSKSFKNARIDDRFIQDLHAKKRLCMQGEEPHTDIEISMIKGN